VHHQEKIVTKTLPQQLKVARSIGAIHVIPSPPKHSESDSPNPITPAQLRLCSIEEDGTPSESFDAQYLAISKSQFLRTILDHECMMSHWCSTPAHNGLFFAISALCHSSLC
jgi:hypothetical protein